MTAALPVSPSPVSISNADRRTAARQDVSIPAKVGFRDRPPIACTVRNVSAMGALIEFDRDMVLPDYFRIIVEVENVLGRL